mgnify:FL=1
MNERTTALFDRGAGDGSYHRIPYQFGVRRCGFAPSALNRYTLSDLIKMLRNAEDHELTANDVFHIGDDLYANNCIRADVCNVHLIAPPPPGCDEHTVFKIGNSYFTNTMSLFGFGPYEEFGPIKEKHGGTSSKALALFRKNPNDQDAETACRKACTQECIDCRKRRTRNGAHIARFAPLAQTTPT